MAAVLGGREVAAAHVEAIGCPLPEIPEAAAAPTFAANSACGAVGAVLVNNVVLVRILGLCPFMGV